jgi:hypothetical protein
MATASAKRAAVVLVGFRHAGAWHEVGDFIPALDRNQFIDWQKLGRVREATSAEKRAGAKKA